MWCCVCVLLTLNTVHIQVSTGEVATPAAIVRAKNVSLLREDATEIQQATCRVVVGGLNATANATVHRTLKGICSSRDLETKFLTLKHEITSQMEKIQLMLLKTNQQLLNLQEIISQKNPHESSIKPFSAPNTGPRDLEVKENNDTLHVDGSGKKVFSYYWRIDDVKDKITQKKKLVTLRSSSFYVNDSYRMYIKMFPNQDKGIVYLHVGLTHGQNDDKLEWPFRLKHRVTIVDQTTDIPKDITSQLWDPAVLCSSYDWQKPSRCRDSEECVGLGFTQDTIFTNNYIFNNSLIIKLDVFV